MLKRSFFLLLMVSMLGLSACSKNETDKPIDGAQAPDGTRIVKVVDKLDASDYSYLEVSDKDNNKFWIAATRVDAVKGDILYFTKSMEMKEFHSKTLDRTFSSILFVDDIRKTPHNMDNGKDGQPSPHANVSGQKANVKVEPLKDGKTVEQIFSNKDALNGKSVKLRGVVVKYNPEIMDRNWIHIQDGTASSNGFDLMVTSLDQVEVGETVVIEGKVITNKDFGAGYSYSVMIEDAKVKVEKKAEKKI